MSADLSPMQEALRTLIAESGARQAVAELRADLERLRERVERHLAEADKDRTDAERDRAELRAMLNRLEAELRRVADAHSAAAAVTTEQHKRSIADAESRAARWKERAAMVAAVGGVIGLAVKEVIQWLRR